MKMYKNDQSQCYEDVMIVMTSSFAFNRISTNPMIKIYIVFSGHYTIHLIKIS